MSVNRMIEWVVLAATVALLILLKWSHLGVLHYNWFLIILLGWTYGLILLFRNTAGRARVSLRGKTS
jgi:hypothetical protein